MHDQASAKTGLKGRVDQKQNQRERSNEEMSDGYILYANEKLTKAVSALAAHPGRIQKRLSSAAMHVNAVEEGLLPEDLQADF